LSGVFEKILLEKRFFSQQILNLTLKVQRAFI